MKKWVFVLCLMMVAALALSACGKSQGDDAAGSQNNAGGAAAGTGNEKDITIHAKNFEFDQTEIKVNKGDTVKITLSNTEGPHTLKIDGYNQIVGDNKTVTFVADKTGEFNYECNTFCGAGHSKMTGKLIVQ